MGDGEATHKVTIELELTEEDLKAVGFHNTHDAEHRMDPEDVVQFHLKGVLLYHLNKLRSRRKWITGDFTKRTGNFPSEPLEGSWECETSPTKLCWYDEHTDPCLDHCLFCGNPHERK